MNKTLDTLARVVALLLLYVLTVRQRGWGALVKRIRFDLARKHLSRVYGYVDAEKTQHADQMKWLAAELMKAQRAFQAAQREARY